MHPFCPLYGDHPTIKELFDYDPFCGIPGEIGRAISRGKPSRARRSGSAAGQFNPDEVTVQDMKQALDNPSLNIKVIDGVRGVIVACSGVESAVLSSA